MTVRSGGRDRRTDSKSNIDVALKRTDVKEWDDEELQYGRRRDKNGNLCGRPPSYIPKACHDELVSRTLQKAEYIMTVAIPDVIPELVGIAKGETVSKPDQVRAINMLMERVLGKPVEHHQVTVEQPWMDALEAALLVGSEDQAKARGAIIDVEPVPEPVDEEDVLWEE